MDIHERCAIEDAKLGITKFDRSFRCSNSVVLHIGFFEIQTYCLNELVKQKKYVEIPIAPRLLADHAS